MISVKESSSVHFWSPPMAIVPLFIKGFESPKKVCENKLGMQDKTISDGTTAATSYDLSTLEPNTRGSSTKPRTVI